MGLPESFGQAAIRHFKDASFLEDDNRLENADQLYGFAVECAIKVALSALPGCVENGKLTERFHCHINVLWGRSALQGLQKTYATLFAVLKSQNPFDTWSVAHRYSANGSISKEDIETRKNFAKRVLGSVGLHGSRNGVNK